METRTVTIMASENDVLEGRNVLITLAVTKDMSDLEVVPAVRRACEEYIRTPEGKREYIGNCHSFNWGDFDVSVPNEICRKYGFEKITQDTDVLTVDANEQLVNEDDYLQENEEE